ncbi:hypothetical protein DICSQDRAFT_176995 [Dichomitus squalens LYAD-421 SS1]|uniref:uncharacterized protein n=1 Tax=Dichomitus squalens (strain LYAD-421) TaxID=732165 RepID=UPI0004413240|nr:uncharacterized protein DICSQDRAFT_176995 [Dichomitus squalens LYAD-421 SS1]EJF67368.1 hypothetical protein DICSQDRAFT_176995 [Dichomitus squalens LYAD-421 SS1]
MVPCLEPRPLCILRRQPSTILEQVQGTSWSFPVDPNLNLHIIRSATLAFTMFTKDASSNDKELPRSSLRNKVSAFGAAIKPKRNGSSRLIAPSAPQSECSTLVEFAIEDVFIKEDAALEFETEDYMLDADNTAWANGKFSVSSFPQRQKAARANHSALTPLPEFLDAENTAWGTARPTVSQPIAKSRGRFLSSSRPVLGTSGVEPEYLDPDDRAWM